MNSLERERLTVWASLAFLCFLFWGAVVTVVYWAVF